jgi:hypothetical protein
MLSHQPEVSRLLHDDRVKRLADDARRPGRSARVPSATSHRQSRPELVAYRLPSRS